ncbi:MAG: OsmC family protein, partial [Anaerolineae bacterium]|nr:OsmC family protein [Anaerolineae bacterium]
MALTMAAVAANKGITLGRLAVSVESRTELADRKAATVFTSRVELDKGLTARERRILFNSARLCEVHKMLRGEITFEEEITE